MTRPTKRRGSVLLRTLATTLLLFATGMLAGCRTERHSDAASPISAYVQPTAQPSSTGYATGLFATATATNAVALAGLILSADPTDGPAPLAVTFQLTFATGVAVPCDDYRIDFGDGTMNRPGMPCGTVVGTATGGTPTATVAVVAAVSPPAPTIAPATVASSAVSPPARTIAPASSSFPPSPFPPYTIPQSHVYAQAGVYRARFTLLSYRQVVGMSNDVTIVVR